MAGTHERCVREKADPIVPLESGPHLNPLGTSSSAIQDNFMSFFSSPFHNLFIQLVMPARAWVWGRPPENGEPASGRSPEGNGFLLQQSPTVSRAWEWDLMSPSAAHAGMLTDLTDIDSDHSWCELVTATATLCPEDSLSQHPSTLQLLHSLCSVMVPVPWKRWRRCSI